MNVCSLIIISSLIKPVSVVIYVQPIYLVKGVYREFYTGNVYFYFSNTFEFLVNIEWAKVLK